MTMREWRLVNETRPDAGDYPVTVVKSHDRDRAVWTNLLQDPDIITEEIKREVAPFFDEGENLGHEDWYPPLA